MVAKRKKAQSNFHVQKRHLWMIFGILFCSFFALVIIAFLIFNSVLFRTSPDGEPEIFVNIVRTETTPNYFSWAKIVASGGLAGLDSDLELYTTEVDLEIHNVGTASASYVDFDVVLLSGNSVLQEQSVHVGRVSASKRITKQVSLSTRAGDVPRALINILTKNTEPRVVIRNVNYE